MTPKEKSYQMKLSYMKGTRQYSERKLREAIDEFKRSMYNIFKYELIIVECYIRRLVEGMIN